MALLRSNIIDLRIPFATYVLIDVSKNLIFYRLSKQCHQTISNVQTFPQKVSLSFSFLMHIKNYITNTRIDIQGSSEGTFIYSGSIIGEKKASIYQK